jgi:hypothetical protein
MIEIELPDGTVLEFPEGTSQDVMRDATVSYIDSQGGQKSSGLGGILYENIIGSGEVDTPGERLGELIRGGTAAVARGMADVPALPANIAQLGAAGVEKLLGMDEPSMVSRGLAALPDTRDMLAAVPGIGAESQYVAPGTAGEYISTAGEFAGGAGLSAGPKAMLRYGAAPGVASEAAGQATEGTAAEPYARAGAALGASLLAAPRTARYTKGPNEGGEIEMANRLSESGIRPTAGQLRDSPTLMRLEGTGGPTALQLDAFTKAALKTAGNETAKRATPKVLRTTQNKITTGMNSILENVDVPITTDLGKSVAEVAEDYFSGTAGRELPVSLRKIGDQLLYTATDPSGGNKIPATTLRKWRTTAGAYTTSTNEMTREAAHALRALIDDASEEALASLGRADDIKKLSTLRNQYRNFLTIADASTKGGRQSARGILTPERVSSASTRTVGKSNRATGRGTDLTELSNDALAMIGSTPTTSPLSMREITVAGGGAGVGAGVGAALGGGIPGALVGAGVGASAPLMLQGLSRSAAVQNALNNPAAFSQAAPVLAPTISGLLSQ